MVIIIYDAGEDYCYVNMWTEVDQVIVIALGQGLLPECNTNQGEAEAENCILAEVWVHGL